MNFETQDVFSNGVETTGGILSGKVSVFSPDKLCFSIKGDSVLLDMDLAKMILTVNLKSSVGASTVVVNSVPLDMLASLSDYKAGWGINDIDTEGAFFVNLGNLVLESSDELTITLTIQEGITQKYNIYCFAVDSVYGLEHIVCTKYIKGSQTQDYVNPNSSEVFLKVAGTPSETAILSVRDNLGKSTIPERAVTAMGSVLAHSGDFDNFGTVWLDMTGYTQNVTFTCASDHERFLVVGRIFDTTRIGRGQQSLVEVKNYEDYIIANDPAKARCLGLI